MKRECRVLLLQCMRENRKPGGDQRDKDLAAEERPVPSQAEGDRETVEEDLKRKEKAEEGDAGKSDRGAKP